MVLSASPDGAGATVPGGYVTIRGNDVVFAHQVRTDAQGRFWFDVPGGHYELYAYRSPDPDVDDEVTVDVTGGDRDVRIVMQ